jgi:hypothetical protein
VRNKPDRQRVDGQHTPPQQQLFRVSIRVSCFGGHVAALASRTIPRRIWHPASGDLVATSD